MKLADDVLKPATVALAIERIVAACHPLAILAFGSRARGRSRPDSDLDLFILLPSAAPDFHALGCRLRALLADLPFSKDIVVSDPETFARASAQLNSIYNAIATDGLTLWQNGLVNTAAVGSVCR